MGIISFLMTSWSPSTEGAAPVSSLRKAAMLFCPRYRDSFGSSSSGKTLAFTLSLVRDLLGGCSGRWGKRNMQASAEAGQMHMPGHLNMNDIPVMYIFKHRSPDKLWYSDIDCLDTEQIALRLGMFVVGQFRLHTSPLWGYTD
jgi:hypothetical protein